MAIATIIAYTGTGASASLSLTYSGSYGLVGQAFSGAFTASGGVPPYTYAITSGSLPSGLTLTASGANGGAVVGTPTQVQTVPFVCQVTDSASNTANTNGSITIYSNVTGPFADVVTGLTLTVVYTPPDATGNYHFQVHGKFIPPLVGSALTIATITQANPGKVTTSAAHGLSTGQWVYIIATMSGSTLPGVFQVTVTSTTQFTIGVNTSTWGAYSSGGTVQLVDPSYAYSAACLITHGVVPSSANPGEPLAANVAPAFSSWNGPSFDVPAVSTQYDVYVYCLQVQTLNQSINNTNTSGSPITISVANAQAYLGGTPTAPVENGTITSAVPYYSLDADGREQWQLQVTGTVSTNSDVQGMELILCPMFYFQGAGGIGTALPSETGSYPGGTVNVYVSPWYPAGLSCTVAGLTGTNYSAATFTISGGVIYPGDVNYCLINNLLCLISQWLSPTTFMISNVQGGTLTNGTFSFASMAARYGISVGDTLSNGTETFTFTGLQAGWPVVGTLVQVSGVWVSGWVLTRSAGAHPSSGSGAIWSDIASSQNTAGQQLGFLSQGQTQGTSGQYPIGAPTAYICYGPSLSTVNIVNPWPVSGTPYAIVGTVSVRTTGSINMNRALADTLGTNLAGGGGFPIQLAQTNTGNLCPNPGFEYPPPGSNWLFTNGSVVSAAVEGLAAHSGLYISQMTAPGSTGVSQTYSEAFIDVEPGQVYSMTVWGAATQPSLNGSVSLNVAFYLSGSYVPPEYQGPPVFPNNSAYQQFGITFTVPPGVNQMKIIPGYWYGGTSGTYVIDDVFLKLISATSGVVTNDAQGNLIVNYSGALGASGGAMVVLSGALTIGYFAAGSSPVQVGYWILTPQYPTNTQTSTSGLPFLPSSQYPQGCIIFNEYNGRTYKNEILLGIQTWCDTGDPGDMIAGTLAAHVIYAGQINCAQLIAGTVAAEIVLTAPDIVVAGSDETITINTATGLQIYSAAALTTYTFSTGIFSISVGPGSSETGLTELSQGSLTMTNTAVGSGHFGVEIGDSPSEAFVEINDSTFSNFVRMQVSSAGAWVCAVSTALDPSAPNGAQTYYAGNLYLKTGGTWTIV